MFGPEEWGADARWLICKDRADGMWFVSLPLISGQKHTVHEFPTGAEALAAFARGAV